MQAGTHRDPVADPVGVLSRLGYLSEENDLPGWMRVEELIRYSRAFYPSWDDAYADELQEMFGLDRTQRIRELSKGQRARAGLVVAMAYRPALLVLDEPSSGLDPIVRRDILAAVIRTIADEGRTVMLSSHLLDEVERVADDVTIIRGGRVAMSAPLAELMASHRAVSVRFEEPMSSPPAGDGVLRWEGRGRDWTAITRSDVPIVDALVGWNAHVVEERDASLDEVFVAHAGTDLHADA